jgi:hypothetical protein
VNRRTVRLASSLLGDGSTKKVTRTVKHKYEGLEDLMPVFTMLGIEGFSTFAPQQIACKHNQKGDKVFDNCYLNGLPRTGAQPQAAQPQVAAPVAPAPVAAPQPAPVVAPAPVAAPVTTATTVFPPAEAAAPAPVMAPPAAIDEIPF